MEYKFDPKLVAEHLSGVISFPTLSNDLEEKMDFNVFFELHKYLENSYPGAHKVLEKELIGKAGLLYRWKGTGKSKALPLLFMAHQDVVPEGNVADWKYPPYSGEVAEGLIWGRGSGDCKCDIVSQLEAVEYLIKSGFQPDYDLYLFYGYNEEVCGGNAPSAAKLAADTLKARGVRLGAVVDEGGGMKNGADNGYSQDICCIGVGEKGYADYEIYRLDKGGHAARPSKNGALSYVARAILAIEENQYPYRITEPVKRYYETLAPLMKEKEPELSELLSDVEGNWEKLLPIIDEKPELASMFHTTMVPTMASGSAQGNILPEKASVVVNCRLLAGDTLEDVKNHILSIIPEGMGIRLVKGNEASPFSPFDTDFAKLIGEAAAKHHPGIVPMPSMMTGGTDAKFMYDVCDVVYRFTSIYSRKTGAGGAHSVNEAINYEDFVKAPEIIAAIIEGYGK